MAGEEGRSQRNEKDLKELLLSVGKNDEHWSRRFRHVVRLVDVPEPIDFVAVGEGGWCQGTAWM